MKKKTLVVAVLLLSFLLSSFSQAVPNGIAALGRFRSSAVARIDSGDAVQSESEALVNNGSVQTENELLDGDGAAQSEDEPQLSGRTPQMLNAASTGSYPYRQHSEAGNLFRAKFEGDRVAGSGEIVDGVYRFTASKTDGEAWHVKLESNYPTVAGRDYRVTYRFYSNVAGKVKFGDFQEFEIAIGDNELTGILIATSGTSYLDLQLGMLAPFTIDFKEIEVKEYADEVEYENALPSPINYEKESVVYERHDQGYAPIPTREEDGISLYYFATPWDTGVWKSRLYIKTGLLPEAGVKYRITADVMSDYDMPFEILFNRGDEEKGYGALYGQKLTAGETTSCEAVITGSENGDILILQFSLGEAPEEATVSLSSIHVEKIIDHYTSVLPKAFAMDKPIETGKILTSSVPVSFRNLALPDFSYSGTDTVYEGHDSDYAVSLEESEDSATLKITHAPADRGVWKVKLYAATGVTPEAGTTYRISYDLASVGDQAKYEACFDGEYENAYGALYNRSLTAGSTDHVEYTVTPDMSHGPLTLRLQLGETNGTDGNTVTLSGLKVEKLSGSTETPLALSGFAYPTTAAGVTDKKSFDLETSNGAAATLSGDGSSAVATVTTGGDDWHIKLYVKPELAVTAGESYTVSMDVAGAEGWNACYKVGAGEEKSFDSSAESEGTYRYTLSPAESGTLEIILKLGAISNGSSVTVSKVGITKAGTGFVPVTLSGFAYPLTSVSGGSIVSAHYEAQTLSLSASAVAWDGSAATASVEGSNASLNVTQARSPDSGGMWSTRLEVNTGVTLEKGEQYKVSGSISSTKPLDAAEVLYSNGAGTVEDAQNPGGQGYAEGSWGLNVESAGGSAYFEKTFTVPDREEYRPLVLRVQVGNGPADNTISVSGITVEKWVSEHEEGGTSSTVPNQFLLETNNETEAALTGDGSSAAVKVITPHDDWNIKLYAPTGVYLEAGKTYRISATVSGTGGWNICYKRAEGEETDFNGDMTFGDTVVNTVTPTQSGTLEIMLKLGAVAANGEVTIRNIQVEEYTSGDFDVLPEGFAYPVTTSGAVTANQFFLEPNAGGFGTEAALTGDGSSATVKVIAPHDDWNIKLYAQTGLYLEAGKTYRISAKISGAGGWNICYKRAEGEENDFNGYMTFGDTVVNTVTPTESGTLEIMLKLGAVAANGEVTISNIQVEELSYGTGESVLPSFRYDSVGSISSAADGGYIVSLDKAVSSATFRIHQAPAERHPWNVKLNIRTGFTPEAWKGYRVSFDIEATNAQNLFEVFYDGSSEMAYGALYEQSLSAGRKTVSYTVMPGDSKGELTVQIRLGATNRTDGNSYTISNLKIEEVTFQTTQFPETREVTDTITQRGYSTKLEKSRDKVVMRIDRTPTDGREAWKNKLFVVTGATLKAGQKYRISMNVKSVIPAPFEVCFNNGDEEKGLGAMFGLLAAPAGQYVEYVCYPKQDIRLSLQLSLGSCSAPNSIFVSNVKVEKAGAVELISDTVYNF